jgi:hypothetical protein
MVRTCDKRNAYGILERKYIQKKEQLEYLGIDVMTVLLLILKGEHGRTWTRVMCFRIRASVGLM